MTKFDKKHENTNQFDFIASKDITQSQQEQQRRESLTTMTKAKEQKILYKTLNHEIRETLQAKMANSQDPKNYIHVGKLYSCQGKQQNSVNILQEGLRVISDPHHHPLIQQQMDIVKVRLKRKIDFIDKCPFEIVHHIVNQLNPRQNTALECLTVSPIWRQKLMNQVHLWRHIEISDVSRGQNVHQGLCDISNLVEHLTIVRSEGTTRRRMMSLKTYSFKNLRSLTIWGSFCMYNETMVDE